jgi:putative transposase
MDLFREGEDYAAFLRLMVDAKSRADVELFGFCLMSNHWHLVLRPRSGGDMAGYLSWLTNTHVKRYRSKYRRSSGHLYRGRYKSFPVQEDGHLLMLMRYVEANPLRVKRVDRAQDWEWSSLGCGKAVSGELLDEWPVERPRGWRGLVNQGMGQSERGRIKASFERDRPLGSDAWVKAIAKKLGLLYTLNPRGRPRKKAGV